MKQQPTHAEQFDYLNPYFFIKQFEGLVDESEGVFELSDPREHTPKKPFALTRFLDDRVHFGTLKWPIIKGVENGRLVEQFLGYDGDEITFNTGYIFGEYGQYRDKGGENTRYETLKIRIKGRNRLKNGILLSPTTIQIAAFGNDTQDVLITPPVYHVRRTLQPWWSRTNLSHLIPAEWLLTESARLTYREIDHREGYAEIVASEKSL